MDEKVSAAPASQSGSAGGSTLGGLLQLSGGMDRSLQYKFRDLSPLSSQLSDSSSWTSDFQNAVRDLEQEEDDNGGSGGSGGSPPGGPPSYLVNVGDEAQTTESGSGTSEDERTETFRIAGQQRSEIWNLAATGGSGLDGSPTEINRGRKGVRNRFGKNSFSVPDTFSCPRASGLCGTAGPRHKALARRWPSWKREFRSNK